MVSHSPLPLLSLTDHSQSAQQHNLHAPQNTQHTDEIPTVQTKAKMNLALSRGGASHFGADSMFESASTLVPSSAHVNHSLIPLIHAGNANLLQTRMRPLRHPSMTCFGNHPLARRRGCHQESVVGHYTVHCPRLIFFRHSLWTVLPFNHPFVHPAQTRHPPHPQSAT